MRILRATLEGLESWRRVVGSRKVAEYFSDLVSSSLQLFHSERHLGGSENLGSCQSFAKQARIEISFSLVLVSCED